MINENINIKNIKFSLFGWTSVLTRSKYGEIRCILVKKNLFKGYSIIDDRGEKISIDRLEDMGGFTDFAHVIQHFKVGRLSSAAAAQVQSMAKYMDSIRLQDINSAVTDVKALADDELANAKEISQHQLSKQQVSFETKIRDEKQARVEFITKYFTNVSCKTREQSGSDINYGDPNTLQQSIGVTTNVEQNQFNIQQNYNIDMKEYLSDLEYAVSDEFKPQISKLREEYATIDDNLKKLSYKFEESVYVSTIILLTSFVEELKTVLIALKQHYPNDLNCYISFGSYNSDDTSSSFSAVTHDLVASGTRVCINLLSDLYGKEAVEDFQNKLNGSEVLDSGVRSI